MERKVLLNNPNLLHLSAFSAINEGVTERKTLYHAYIKEAKDSLAWLHDVDLNDDRTDASWKLQLLFLIEKFSGYWTIHGPPRIFTSTSTLRRIIWFIIWVTMVLIGYVQCFAVISEYLTYPKKVSIDIVDETVMEFPAVSICSLNPFPFKNKSNILNPENKSSVEIEDKDYFWTNLVDIERSYLDQDMCEEIEETYSGDYDYYDYYDYMDDWTFNFNNKTKNESESGTTKTTATYQQTGEADDAIPGSVTPSGYSQEEAKKSPAQLLAEGPSSEQNGLNNKKKGFAKKTFDEQMTEEEKLIHNLRLKCSAHYSRLGGGMVLEDANFFFHGEFLNRDHSKCPIADFNENITMDHICITVLIRDNWGTYNEHLKECSLYTTDPDNDITCSTCCNEYLPLCIATEEYKAKALNPFVIPEHSEIQMALKKSDTRDAIDVTSSFLPTKEDLKKHSPFSRRNFIEICSFDQMNCSFKDFNEWVSDEYGVCYTFNSFFQKFKKGDRFYPRPVKKTTAFGQGNGLRLTLNIHTTNTLSLLSTQIGVKVIIHKPDTQPFPEDEGINVLPGFFSAVNVKTKRIIRATPPHGRCGHVKLNSKYRYTKTLCQKLCLEEEYGRTCNCSYGHNPAYSKLQKSQAVQPCSRFNPVQNFCVKSVQFNHYRGALKCKCPPSCSETIYDKSVSYSETNLNYYKIVQNIKKMSAGADLCESSQNNTIRLHVYLDQLSYEQIAEAPSYTFETLIANLGGNFGLFIGMSIVSIFELLEFFLDVFLFLIKKKKTHPKKATGDKRIPVYLLVEHSAPNIDDRDGETRKGTLKAIFSPSREQKTQAKMMLFDKLFSD